MVTDILAVGLAYGVGSVPFAHLLARRRGVDLRRVGSGNVGATNVLRTSGVRQAVLAMSLDAGKGSLAVLIAQGLSGGAATPVAAGLASMLGHVYPVWLGFRGGKGVATAAGAFAVLAPVALLTALVVFVSAVWLTRYISLGSVTAALALALTTGLTGGAGPVLAGATAAAAVVIHRHRANLVRIVAGTERSIGQRL
ncbi:MAG: glycerol-3-phosphate 1-O-acyltransferase PlsY [Vicinamibacterales bacterium]